MPATAEDILDTLSAQLRRGLEQGFITLVTHGKGQARRESTENEEIIGRSLRAFVAGHPWFQGDLTFSVATNGAWYDFLVESADGRVWLPINLKVSNLQGHDNVASKAGLFYAMTGVRPTHAAIRNWDVFCENLAARLQREDCASDYYFLVVEKSAAGVGRVFWTSLLQLRAVTPNGSNPPFQACWSHNMERSGRPRSEAVDHLLNVVGQTFVLRAKALQSFRRHVVPRLEAGLRAEWQGDGPVVEGESD
ncbi:MAG: hypothetical protein REI09_05690 [Candidatus Dactylopiibacterium sp.]|nr:hypothetical protein [Candidatus Dactylopiibacterium sp.]